MAGFYKRLEMYRLDAHQGDQPPDYAALFRRLAAIRVEDRYVQAGDTIHQLATVGVRRDSTVFLKVMLGHVNEHPLILDLATGAATVLSLRPNQVNVHVTHAMLDLTNRYAVVEYNHVGARASSLAGLLVGLGEQKLNMNLTVSLTPVPTTQFIDELNRFRKIKIARVEFQRPNQDWSDHSNALMQTLVPESNADRLTLEIAALGQNELAQNEGVMGWIRRLINGPAPLLHNAKIEGVRQGEEQPTSISLSHFVEHQKVQIRRVGGGLVDDDDIARKMHAFLMTRRQR